MARQAAPPRPTARPACSVAAPSESARAAPPRPQAAPPLPPRGGAGGGERAVAEAPLLPLDPEPPTRTAAAAREPAARAPSAGACPPPLPRRARLFGGGADRDALAEERVDDLFVAQPAVAQPRGPRSPAAAAVAAEVATAGASGSSAAALGDVERSLGSIVAALRELPSVRSKDGTLTATAAAAARAELLRAPLPAQPPPSADLPLPAPDTTDVRHFESYVVAAENEAAATAKLGLFGGGLA
jgi:hypothetical protein